MSDSVGWHEPLTVKYMCDEKCNEERFKFYHIAAILVAKRRNKSSQIWSDKISLRAGCRPPSVQIDFPKNVGATYDQKEVDEAFVGRSNQSSAPGDKQQLAK